MNRIWATALTNKATGKEGYFYAMNDSHAGAVDHYQHCANVEDWHVEWDEGKTFAVVRCAADESVIAPIPNATFGNGPHCHYKNVLDVAGAIVESV